MNYKIPENLVEIGSFTSYKPGKPEMPVTTYLFGCLTGTQNTTNTQAPEQSPDQQSMGSNPATWAPVTFQPSEQFAGNGLVGNYFSSTQIATIHDPSEQNTESYTFKNVQQRG